MTKTATIEVRANDLSQPLVISNFLRGIYEKRLGSGSDSLR